MRTKLITAAIILTATLNCYALEGDNYNDLSAFPKWQHVLKEQALPKPNHHIVTKDDLIKLNAEDNHKIKFKNDGENNWQTPNQTIVRGTGNCKDYATLKYYQLEKMGLHPDDMMIVVGTYRSLNELHAVLQVTLDDGETYILDNLTDTLQIAKDYYANKFDVAYGINNTRWTRTPGRQ